MGRLTDRAFDSDEKKNKIHFILRIKKNLLQAAAAKKPSAELKAFLLALYTGCNMNAHVELTVVHY